MTQIASDIRDCIANVLTNNIFVLHVVVTEFIVFLVSLLFHFKEFCVFALFGFGSDVFLQMFFFTPVLSIDIRRMEVSHVLFEMLSSFVTWHMFRNN